MPRFAIEKTSTLAFGLALGLLTILPGSGSAQDHEGDTPIRVQEVRLRLGDSQKVEEIGMILLEARVEVPGEESDHFGFDVVRSDGDEEFLASGDVESSDDEEGFTLQTSWPVVLEDCGKTTRVVVTLFEEEGIYDPVTEEASIEVPEDFCEGLELELFE